MKKTKKNNGFFFLVISLRSTPGQQLKENTQFVPVGVSVCVWEWLCALATRRGRQHGTGSSNPVTLRGLKGMDSKHLVTLDDSGKEKKCLDGLQCFCVIWPRFSLNYGLMTIIHVCMSLSFRLLLFFLALTQHPMFQNAASADKTETCSSMLLKWAHPTSWTAHFSSNFIVYGLQILLGRKCFIFSSVKDRNVNNQGRNSCLVRR